MKKSKVSRNTLLLTKKVCLHIEHMRRKLFLLAPRLAYNFEFL